MSAELDTEMTESIKWEAMKRSIEEKIKSHTAQLHKDTWDKLMELRKYHSEVMGTLDPSIEGHRSLCVCHSPPIKTT